MSPAVVHRVSVFSLTVPLPRQFGRASDERLAAKSVIVAIELVNGTVGYGEAHPQPEGTSEHVEPVVDAVSNVFVPYLMDFHPASFPEVLEAAEGLPWFDAEGQWLAVTRAAVEVALLDATMRRFGRDIDAVVQWMGLPGFGVPGSLPHVRFSGMLTGESLPSTLRQLRRMYWGGLRQFKLEMGLPDDRERLARVAAYLRRPLAGGRCTLRIDLNGRWSKDEAIDRLAAAADIPIAALEQPLERGREEDLLILRDLFDIPIIHDESVVTIEDGVRLVSLGVADGFNIRIGKCGGLIPSLRLAALARREGVRLQLGCAVGETSILSAAALRFLQVSPGVEWAEGCYGPLLLAGDVVAKGLRFGYGGRPPQIHGGGLGPPVDTQRLTLLCDRKPLVINL